MATKDEVLICLRDSLSATPTAVKMCNVIALLAIAESHTLINMLYELVY